MCPLAHHQLGNLTLEMKKILLCIALGGIASTASAQSVKIEMEYYVGDEPVRTYSVIVEDRQAVEVQDKEIRQYRELTEAGLSKTGRGSGEPHYETKNLDLGLSLKLKPIVLTDGRILLDAGYSRTSLLGMKKERVNGFLTDSPQTRLFEGSTQIILPASFGNYDPDKAASPPYALTHNDVRFVFKATKI